MPRRWMLYSHDATGLGHVRCSLAIAGAALSLRPDLAAFLVTCSPMMGELPLPAGMSYIRLPGARKTASQPYSARSLAMENESFRVVRAGLLRESAERFDPELTLVDKSPTGRMGELTGTLEAVHRSGRAAVLGLRDILDEPEGVAREWKCAGLTRFVERHYREIWIYGDRDLFDAGAVYGWPSSLLERVRYLGYLAPAVSEEARRAARVRLGADDGPLALVTVGGGEDGAELVAAYLRTAEAGLLPAELRSVVVLGPGMPAGAQAALRTMAPADVRVEEFVPDLAPAIAAADVVVGMAGYGTVCELLAAGTPAVLVPRTMPHREQWLRARALEARGLAQMLEPQHVEPRVLADRIHHAIEVGRMDEGRPALDGLQQLAHQVSRLLPWERPGAELYSDRHGTAMAVADHTVAGEPR